MNESSLKLAVVAALRAPVDLTQLPRLRESSERETARLLRWLDESGLALYFLRQLDSSACRREVPAHVLRQLERRQESNRLRMQEMFVKLARVNCALNQSGVRYAIIKGFTLAPEFCPDIFMRHQSDIDVLVGASDLGCARDAVANCGYSPEEEGPGGEVRMSGPLLHCPTKHDDIYAIQRHRRVEIHTSIFEELQGVRIDAPTDCLSWAVLKTINGESFPVLRLGDRFLLQCLHAFRHVLASWGRLGWLYEISYFLERHQCEASLWEQVSERIMSNDLRMACGLVLLLTEKLFSSPIPLALRNCTDSSTARVRAWVEEFGCEWALSGVEGSKTSLFIHREFVSDRNEWRSWLRRRLLPIEQRPALAPHRSSPSRMRDRVQQGLRYADRTFYHARALISYASNLVRWRRALQHL